MDTMYEGLHSFWRTSIRGRPYFLLLAFVLTGLVYYSSMYHSIPRHIPELKPSEILNSIVPGRLDLLTLVVSNMNLTTKIPKYVPTRIEAKNFKVTADNTALPSETSKTFDSLRIEPISTTEVPTGVEAMRYRTDLEENITFSKVIMDFDWSSYITAVKYYNRSLMKACLEKLIIDLSNFLALPPIVPINSECKAPPLAPPEQIKCSDYLTGLTGVRNNKTSKIGMFIIFGFDVDVFEIYLNEMYDVVDKIFIIESTKSHLMTLPKPLMWEEVKHQKRFIKFAPKAVHMIVDDAENEDAVVKTNSDPRSIWLMETLQEKLLWEKFLEWNKASNFFSSSDIFGFGDADEIPSRKMLNVLKYCQLKNGWADIGIWFAYGNINLAHKTDWPVRDHPYTFGAPTFRTLQSALNFYKEKGEINGLNFRTRGKGPNFLLGGMHMTHYGYLPYQLVKRITASEYSPFSMNEATKFSKKLTFEDIRALELHYAKPHEYARGRVVNLTSISEEMKDIAILPWFYDCNRDRYPVWEGRHDSRLY